MRTKKKKKRTKRKQIGGGDPEGPDPAAIHEKLKGELEGILKPSAAYEAPVEPREEFSDIIQEIERIKGDIKGIKEENELLKETMNLMNLKKVSRSSKEFDRVKKGRHLPLPLDLKDDKDVILDMVKQKPSMIEFASDELKRDKDLIQAAGALQYASAEEKRDKEFVLAAVQKDGAALQYASAELKGDKEIVLAAVQKDGRALQYASAELKGDKEIVLAAVRIQGLALQYASAELKGDKEIVLAAVNQNPYNLTFVPPELQKDPEILKVLKQVRGY